MGNILNKKKIKRIFRKSKKIYLMAHTNLDLDALGSCIGLYNILNRKKECFIIIDDKEHELGVKKVLKELDGCLNIIESKQIDKEKIGKKNLLVILDTNNQSMVQNSKIIDFFDKKLVIDHHEVSKKTIKDAELFIKTDASSTCEIITDLIEYYDIDTDSYYATLLLAGIVLDTNNFTLKTSPNTYYSAYYLSCLGASAKKVQYLLKQDINEYAESQKLLTNIEMYNSSIAISKGNAKTIYRKEELARTASTLLYFNDVESSFVIGKVDKDKVGVSARSFGNKNIEKIIEKLGGGGDDYHCATVINKKTINEVEKMIKDEIKKQEGE